MSKSLGNFITIRQILETDLPQFHDGVDKEYRVKWCGLVARFSMLQTHYREPINWTGKRLIEASHELYRWYQRVWLMDIKPNSAEVDEEIIAALADDLNSWQAITVLRRLYKENKIEKLAASLELMGLLDKEFFTNSSHPLFMRSATISNDIIEQRISERLEAINTKNWVKADEIRENLRLIGVNLIDKKHASTGERITEWEFK